MLHIFIHMYVITHVYHAYIYIYLNIIIMYDNSYQYKYQLYSVKLDSNSAINDSL